jgi:phosphatidylserine decarboxylase
MREIGVATIVLAAVACGLGLLWWPLAVFPLAIWLWVISFFRDPPRHGRFGDDELGSPADGTVTEITELEHHSTIGGPALRIGIFLSLFNVHVNRMPCAGRIRDIRYKKGEFLDARHKESGERNESNTLLIDPDGSLPGPVIVRQVAGLVARRIICHAKPGEPWKRGGRFGMIKFGSRTELIVPRLESTEISVRIGDKVYGGLTPLVRQASPACGIRTTACEYANPGESLETVSAKPG